MVLAPCRLLQALWVRWRPPLAVVDADSWQLHKLGSVISPTEVLRNGSQAMHAVQDAGVSVSGRGDSAGEQLSIKVGCTACI